MSKLIQPREHTISRRSHSFPFFSMVGALACLIALDIGSSAHAQTLTPPPPWTVTPIACPDGTKICKMTIKIFNNESNRWIYPVLTTGMGPEDIWMQAWWSVPQTSLGQYPFPRRKIYRLFINPTGAGIPPNTGIELTVPLFTQLKEPLQGKPTAEDPNKTPTGGDTLINWWNGGVIHIYQSPTASPPPALSEAFNSANAGGETGRFAVQSTVPTAILPNCVGVKSAPTQTAPTPPAPPPCQPLTIYSDVSDLPKNDPHQLLEFTLGAKNASLDPTKGPAYFLDVRNVDFDVSYVNVAFLPAVMGPYKNDQVRYVGTPITTDNFRVALNQFLADNPGWPQLLRKGVLLQKLASPLEAFSRLGGKDPPPDLTQVPSWPGSWPNEIWGPIETMRANWKKYAGTVRADAAAPYVTATPGLCGPLPDPSAPAPTNFCAGIVAVQQLMIKNYTNYRKLFAAGKCLGTPLDITDNVLISHVYGWAPWTESKTGLPGEGCAPDQNKLEKTEGYNKEIKPGVFDYKNYLNVKVAFDKLNYGKLLPKEYKFNPWVEFIHGVPGAVPDKYINTPYAYAYSVDDAFGNIQAEGQGFIVDIGGTVNLENQKPASAPITVSVGGTNDKNIKFIAYAVCKIGNRKEMNPRYTSFAVSANDPANCPIYLWDDKSPSQLYAFKIDAKPDQFPFFEDPSVAKWTAGDAANSTTKPVVCSGLPDAGKAQGYQPTSETFCCNSADKSGIFAFAQSVPDVAHATKEYNVTTMPPSRCTNYTNPACWAPNPLPQPGKQYKACNKGL